MKLHVHKHPDARTIAQCTEVADNAPVPLAPLELMTREAFTAWRAVQPPLAPPPPTAQETDDAADSTEGTALVALWAKFVDGTITAAEQRRVLKWLFKLELKKRGL